MLCIAYCRFDDGQNMQTMLLITINAKKKQQLKHKTNKQNTQTQMTEGEIWPDYDLICGLDDRITIKNDELVSSNI